MANRIQLNDQDVENVVGGAFNWYKDPTGAQRCRVDYVGDFAAAPNAMERFYELKLQHRYDKWSAAQYTQALVDEGFFS